MQFFVVYIKEAHPSDGWQVGINEREDIIYKQPATIEERVEVAAACSLRLDISIPTLLDEMTDEVNDAYAALPDRLYLIGGDGRIVYHSDRGPRGFKPDEFESAIQTHLAERSED